MDHDTAPLASPFSREIETQRLGFFFVSYHNSLILFLSLLIKQSC